MHAILLQRRKKQYKRAHRLFTKITVNNGYTITATLYSLKQTCLNAS